MSKGLELEEEGRAKGLVHHIGGCHCGAVKFEVLAPPVITVIRCNCSVCTKKQNLHFIVPESQFRLIQGEESLTTYAFNTKVAKHTFCKVCGVQSFYSPRSNPDGKGIMPHCIDGNTLKEVNYETFNGDEWEQEIGKKKDHIQAMSKA